MQQILQDMATPLDGVLVYRTRYGTTLQYAEWIKKELRIPMIDPERMDDQVLSACDFLVIGTPVYQGEMLIRDWLYQNERRLEGKRLFLFIACSHFADREKQQIMIKDNIPASILARCEPYFMPELDLAKLKERIAPQFMPVFEKIGICGMIVVRLRARGENLGYLALFRTNQKRSPYSEDDLNLVKDLADRAALAIDTSRLLDGLEKRVAERTEALEASNRELEAFAFSVSHVLKSPLRAIDGFSRLVEEDYGDKLDEEGRRMLATVRRNAQHMSHLIEDLLRLSRLGHKALQPLTEIDMREVPGILLGLLGHN